MKTAMSAIDEAGIEATAAGLKTNQIGREEVRRINAVPDGRVLTRPGSPTASVQEFVKNTRVEILSCGNRLDGTVDDGGIILVHRRTTGNGGDRAAPTSRSLLLPT